METTTEYQISDLTISKVIRLLLNYGQQLHLNSSEIRLISTHLSKCRNIKEKPYISDQNLMDKMGCCRATVKNIKKKLVERGLLIVEPRFQPSRRTGNPRQTTNEYDYTPLFSKLLELEKTLKFSSVDRPTPVYTLGGQTVQKNRPPPTKPGLTDQTPIDSYHLHDKIRHINEIDQGTSSSSTLQVLGKGDVTHRMNKNRFRATWSRDPSPQTDLRTDLNALVEETASLSDQLHSSRVAKKRPQVRDVPDEASQRRAEIEQLERFWGERFQSRFPNALYRPWNMPQFAKGGKSLGRERGRKLIDLTGFQGAQDLVAYTIDRYEDITTKKNREIYPYPSIGFVLTIATNALDRATLWRELGDLRMKQEQESLSADESDRLDTLQSEFKESGRDDPNWKRSSWKRK